MGMFSSGSLATANREKRDGSQLLSLWTTIVSVCLFQWDAWVVAKLTLPISTDGTCTCGLDEGGKRLWKLRGSGAILAVWVMTDGQTRVAACKQRIGR